MSIVGGIIGFIAGTPVGLCTPAIMFDIYPKKWSESYKNNGAILLATGVAGAIGGTICGTISGNISNKNINDYGFVGGAFGGTLGALAAGTYAVYKNSR